MLLLVMAFCAPSFGADANFAVLVYKVALTEKPVIIDANYVTAFDNNDTASSVKSSASFKGYFVFEVNTVDLNTVQETNGVSDDNQIPKLVLTGKNPKTGAADVWVLEGSTSDVTISRMITTEAKPKKFAYLYINDLSGVTDANLYIWGESWGTLAGTVLVKGSKAKVEVPKSLKGSGNFENWISDSNVPFSSPIDGAMNLTLDTAKTQTANFTGQTVKDVVDSL